MLLINVGTLSSGPAIANALGDNAKLGGMLSVPLNVWEALHSFPKFRASL
jgi:hypothetical protein